jgi:hypothetical protein
MPKLEFLSNLLKLQKEERTKKEPRELICKICKQRIERVPYANNVKFCKDCRVEVYKYKEYRSRWQRDRADRNARNYDARKLPCVVCGKYYIKPVAHAWQIHQVDAVQYKEYAGLDKGRGVIPEYHREILREHALKNRDKVINENLLIKGRKSRFTKGDERVGRYTRSPQTLERLKNQLKKSHGNTN